MEAENPMWQTSQGTRKEKTIMRRSKSIYQ